MTTGKTYLLGLGALSVAILMWSLSSGGDNSPRFYPSGNAAYLPKPEDSFDTYLSENQQRIRAVLSKYYYEQEDSPFGDDLTLEQVLEMRSPFQYLPATTCLEEPRRGFLLVHGLTDSPYLLRSVASSLHQQFPCALIRTLLSPGHGTVPGDLLEVRLEHWEDTFSWGVESLSGTVEEVTVLGYSNGSALAINYLNSQTSENLPAIDRMVLISPGLKPADNRAFLAPFLKFVRPWIYQRGDRDAVKYESFPTNAAAEFYNLTRKTTASDSPKLVTPTLMIVSGDDTTTDAGAAVEMFCNKIDATDKQLIWYQSSSAQSQLPQNCDGITVVGVGSSELFDRVVSLSHIALTTPVSDEHYGLDGRYPVCLSHEANPTRFARCQSDNSNSIYGESTFLDENGEYEGAIVRRTSFNTEFDTMMQSVFCFVRSDCE